MVLATGPEWPTFWVQLVYTCATLLILVVAIWGNQIRAWVAAPRLTINVNDPPGILLTGEGRKTWYFHLRVTNSRPFSTGVATIVCTRLEYCNKEGVFVPVACPGSLPLLWAPSELYGFRRTIGDEATCDLGHIGDASTEFNLAFGFRYGNMRGTVKKGEVARVHLAAEVDGYRQQAASVIEIQWNGDWSDDASAMYQNLKVTVLSSDGAVLN